MLQLYPTKNGTGVQILGDYTDLRTLYLTIDKLSERLDPEAVNTKGKSTILMALAYEVRKAYSGRRETEGLTFDGTHQVTYMGFNYLWTDMVIAYNILRNEAGYLTTGPLDQACLYLLEAQLSRAMTAYDVKQGALLQEFLGKWIDVNHPYIYLISQSIAHDYLTFKAGKSRFAKIPALFTAYFNEQSPPYRAMFNNLQQSAAEKGCGILDLEFGDLPEFKW